MLYTYKEFWFTLGGKYALKLFKKLTAAVLSCVLIIGGVAAYNSYGEQTLRVGLERYYMGVQTVTAKNTSLTIAYKGGSQKLDSTSGFTFEPVSGSFSARRQFSSMKDALESGNAVYDADGWCSYIAADGAEKETASETTTAQTYFEEATVLPNAEFVSETTTQAAAHVTAAPADTYTYLPTAIKVTYQGGSFVLNTDGCVTLTSADNVIDLGEMAYRGKIEFTSVGNAINTVNILTMDQYLYGVVPSEVYPEWPQEALKAQAVAARTYAQYHIGKHSNYDLCDHTHCQQYSGYRKEEASTNKAVDATSGEIAYYNGRPINSVYYDCDGGYTLSAEEVWGSDIPYLQSVPDPYELNARKWEKSFTLDEITALAKQNDMDIGDVTAVEITKKRGDILAEEIKLTGTKGSDVIKGQDIKTFFQKDGENLWSRAFTVSGSSAPSNNVYVTGVYGSADNLRLNVVSAVDSKGQVTVLDDINCVLRGKDGDVVISASGGTLTEAHDSIVFSGTGWGHGVGMSQCGAYGMAEKGHDYKEILKYYYKGIEVK